MVKDTEANSIFSRLGPRVFILQPQKYFAQKDHLCALNTQLMCALLAQNAAYAAATPNKKHGTYCSCNQTQNASQHIQSSKSVPSQKKPRKKRLTFTRCKKNPTPANASFSETMNAQFTFKDL
jgi:hypothetical protein